MPIRPGDLPRLRRQVLAQLDDPSAPVRAKTGASNQEALDRLASHLRAADLYWVAPEMAALSVHAGGELAASTWTLGDRPSGCGLLWWGDGVHQLNFGGGVHAPIDAVSWGPSENGTVVWVFIHRSRVEEATRTLGGQLVSADVPPLVPMRGNVLPIEVEPLSVAELAARQAGDGKVPASMLMTLAAAWALMQQPTLVERTLESAGKAEARSAARAGLPAPEYSRVDLRRQWVPRDQDAAGDGDARRYRYRWVVSGHWRQQPYGPDRSLRRQQWIPAHVKGPDGAPLLATEKVNVWRR